MRPVVQEVYPNRGIRRKKDLGTKPGGKLVISDCLENLFIRLRRRPGLCPWMNAQNVAESFTYRSIDAPGDFAIGG
jgi:hypothetical protein